VGNIEHIILIAMGPTWYQCPKRDLMDDSPKVEVWGINTVFRSYFGLDKLFMMHDVRTEILLNDYDFINTVNKEGMPVYTAGDYPCLINNVPYPIEKVMSEFRVGYFLNSLSYMMAFAIMQEPATISLFGIDMRPDSSYEWHMNEKGCVEFWCGAAVSRGILLNIPKESYVMRQAITGTFYGFIPRKNPDGLVHMVPANDRRKYHRYKLIPVDDDGNELSEPVILTPKSLMGQQNNVTYEGVKVKDVKI